MYKWSRGESNQTSGQMCRYAYNDTTQWPTSSIFSLLCVFIVLLALRWSGTMPKSWSPLENNTNISDHWICFDSPCGGGTDVILYGWLIHTFNMPLPTLLNGIFAANDDQYLFLDQYPKQFYVLNSTLASPKRIAINLNIINELSCTISFNQTFQFNSMPFLQIQFCVYDI